jgi:hypothetical protein
MVVFPALSRPRSKSLISLSFCLIFLRIVNSPIASSIENKIKTMLLFGQFQMSFVSGLVLSLAVMGDKAAYWYLGEAFECHHFHF